MTQRRSGIAVGASTLRRAAGGAASLVPGRGSIAMQVSPLLGDERGLVEGASRGAQRVRRLESA